MTKTKFAFDHGLDDFKHGIETLIGLSLSNSTEDQRQHIFTMMIEDCHDYCSPGLEALLLELSNYVAWCSNSGDVSQALQRVLLEGQDIERHNRKKITSKGTKKAAEARTATAKENHLVWRDMAKTIRLKNGAQSDRQIAEKISSELELTPYKGSADRIRRII
jgi:hypothetical protein